MNLFQRIDAEYFLPKGIRSFAKSLRSNLSTLISKSKGLGKKLVTKTKEVRIQITEELLRESSDFKYHRHEGQSSQRFWQKSPQQSIRDLKPI